MGRARFVAHGRAVPFMALLRGRDRRTRSQQHQPQPGEGRAEKEGCQSAGETHGRNLPDQEANEKRTWAVAGRTVVSPLR